MESQGVAVVHDGDKDLTDEDLTMGIGESKSTKEGEAAGQGEELQTSDMGGPFTQPVNDDDTNVVYMGSEGIGSGVEVAGEQEGHGGGGEVEGKKEGTEVAGEGEQEGIRGGGEVELQESGNVAADAGFGKEGIGDGNEGFETAGGFDDKLQGGEKASDARDQLHENTSEGNQMPHPPKQQTNEVAPAGDTEQNLDEGGNTPHRPPSGHIIANFEAGHDAGSAPSSNVKNIEERGRMEEQPSLGAEDPMETEDLKAEWDRGARDRTNDHEDEVEKISPSGQKPDQSELQLLQKLLAPWIDKYEKAQVDYKILEKRFEDLQEKHFGLQQEYDDVKKALEEKRQTQGDNDVIVELNARLSVLHRDLSASEARAAKAEEQRRSAESRLSDLEATIANLEAMRAADAVRIQQAEERARRAVGVQLSVAELLKVAAEEAESVSNGQENIIARISESQQVSQMHAATARASAEKIRTQLMRVMEECRMSQGTENMLEDLLREGDKRKAELLQQAPLRYLTNGELEHVDLLAKPLEAPTEVATEKVSRPAEARDVGEARTTWMAPHRREDKGKNINEEGQAAVTPRKGQEQGLQKDVGEPPVTPGAPQGERPRPQPPGEKDVNQGASLVRKIPGEQEALKASQAPGELEAQQEAAQGGAQGPQAPSVDSTAGQLIGISSTGAAHAEAGAVPITRVAVRLSVTRGHVDSSSVAVAVRGSEQQAAGEDRLWQIQVTEGDQQHAAGKEVGVENQRHLEGGSKGAVTEPMQTETQGDDSDEAMEEEGGQAVEGDVSGGAGSPVEASLEAASTEATEPGTEAPSGEMEAATHGLQPSEEMEQEGPGPHEPWLRSLDQWGNGLMTSSQLRMLRSNKGKAPLVRHFAYFMHRHFRRSKKGEEGTLAHDIYRDYKNYSEEHPCGIGEKKELPTSHRSAILHEILHARKPGKQHSRLTRYNVMPTDAN